MKTTFFRLAGVATFGSAAYYPIKVSNTDFYYQKTDENVKVLSRCSQHLNRYMPSLYLFPHGAFQALWNIYGAKDIHIPIQYERDVLTMDDGGSVSIDWAYPPEDLKNPNQNQTKVCMIFPGLSGSSDKGYIKSIVKHLSQEKGYIVGVFHNRGVHTEYTSPKFADLTSNEEIEKVLIHMKKKFGDRQNVRYVGVGMSMGGNLMLRMAGIQKDNFPLEAMVSFNNPFDIWLAINLMRGTPYEKFLARELRKNTIIRENPSDQEKEVFKQIQEKFNLDFDKLKKVESWRDFDRELTMKIHLKFKSVAEYYYAASCLYNVKDIKKHTLVIHSKDDPIIPIECCPVDECLANDKIIVGIVRKGGHVCYFQGINGQKRWYPLVSGEYLDAVLSLKEDKQEESSGLTLNTPVAL
eukprot:403335026